MKQYSAFLWILPVLLLFSSCTKKEDDSPLPDINVTRCVIQEPGGSAENMESTDPTVEFNGDTTEIDNSFGRSKWLWFQVKGQTPGTYNLNLGTNRAIYNSSLNVEFSTIAGTITFATVDKAAKKIKGTFDNMVLVSISGTDTVRINDGTFNIDN